MVDLSMGDTANEKNAQLPPLLLFPFGVCFEHDYDSGAARKLFSFYALGN